MRIKLLSFLFFAAFGANGFSQCIEITTQPAADIFCPGDEITLTATSGYASYSWYYNFQNSTEGGNLFETGDNSITLNAAEWAVTYWYVVAEDDVCTEPSPTVVWDGWVFAPIAIAHDFPAAFCPGDSSLIEIAFNGPVNFQWYKDFAPIEGATESSYWVTEAGYYTLQASYPECPDYWLNSGVGPDFSVYTPQIPGIFLEVMDGTPELSVQGISDTQWYLNDEPIDGATEAVLIPEEDGVYTVSGIDDNGCDVTSDPYNFNSLFTGDIKATDIAVIFPNPTRDEVNVRLNSGAIQAIHMYDMAGKLVLSPDIPASEELVQFSIDRLSPGAYLVRVTAGNGDSASSPIVITE